MGVTINLDNDRLLLVCCVYLPPDDMAAYTSFSSKMADLSLVDDSYVLVCGDFNLSTTQWLRQGDNRYLDPLHIEQKYSQLIFNLSFHGCIQFNDVFNYNNRLLDLIFSNKNNISELIHCTNALVQEDAHHPCVEFLYNTYSYKTLHFNVNTYFNFKKANYFQINQEIEGVNWHATFLNKSINGAVESFYSIINNIVNKHVPTYTKNKYFPTFYSPNTIKVVKQKNKMHKKWKRYKNPNDYLLFKTLRAQSKIFIELDFNSYIRSVENDLCNNPNRFWRYASIKKQSVSGIPNELYWEGNTAANGVDISNLFGSYFSSVFEPENHVFDHFSVPQPLHGESLQKIVLDNEEVASGLLGLDPAKGGGPDKLPALFFKRTAATIARPLTQIYNHSLSIGEFPGEWRTAMVIPIFKSGDKKDVKNYRPISKLSVAGKLFEKLVYSRIHNFIISNLGPEQHGFFRGRSLETNLFLFMEYIHAHLDSRIQVDAIYTDFSKAFDKISHNILLARLAEVGVSGTLLDWIQSYLTGRSQFVQIQGFCSDRFAPTSGVPQGSHLGPLFFIVYINKIRSCFQHCNILLYADDLKIFNRIHSISDCMNVQADLNRFVHFFLACGARTLLLFSQYSLILIVDIWRFFSYFACILLLG